LIDRIGLPAVALLCLLLAVATTAVVVRLLSKRFGGKVPDSVKVGTFAAAFVAYPLLAVLFLK